MARDLVLSFLSAAYGRYVISILFLVVDLTCIIIYEEIQAVLQNYGSGALYTTGCSCRDIALNKMNYSSIHRSKALPYNWEF